jgi:hypothetical protein
MAHLIGKASVWNNGLYSPYKERIVVGYVLNVEYPYVCSDGSMWQNMELIEETENDKIDYWLDRCIPSHHSSGEYKCYPTK